MPLKKNGTIRWTNKKYKRKGETELNIPNPANQRDLGVPERNKPIVPERKAMPRKYNPATAMLALRAGKIMTIRIRREPARLKIKEVKAYGCSFAKELGSGAEAYSTFIEPLFLYCWLDADCIH